MYPWNTGLHTTCQILSWCFQKPHQGDWSVRPVMAKILKAVNREGSEMRERKRKRESRGAGKGDSRSGHSWVELIAFIQLNVNFKNYKDGKHTVGKKKEVSTSLHCFKYTAFSQRPLEGKNDRVMTNTWISSKVIQGTKNGIKWDRTHVKGS